jgi:hypothetical protein
MRVNRRFRYGGLRVIDGRLDGGSGVYRGGRWERYVAAVLRR